MMRAVHLDPKEAFEACKQMKAIRAVPIHWGVFPLGYSSPISDIEKAKQVWEDDSLRRLKVGGILEWNGKTFEEATDSYSLLEN